jgi:hypothetical protein
MGHDNFIRPAGSQDCKPRPLTKSPRLESKSPNSGRIEGEIDTGKSGHRMYWVNDRNSDNGDEGNHLEQDPMYWVNDRNSEPTFGSMIGILMGMKGNHLEQDPIYWVIDRNSDNGDEGEPPGTGSYV